MVSGILGLLALAAGLNGSTPGPDKVAQRYRLDVTIKQEVDLTAAGQGPQVSDITGVAFVNLTMSDTTGGKLAHVVIDSVTITATGQMGMMFSQSLADSLRGQSLHAYIVDGKPSGPAKPSVEGNPVFNIVMPVVQALFPGVGSKGSNAQSWSDTTRNDVTNEQGSQNTQQVVNWTVTGRDGAALSLTSTGNGTVTADMNGQQISGTVVSEGTVTTPIGGPASKATLNTTQELSVLVAALPEPIPVKITSTATLTMMP